MKKYVKPEMKVYDMEPTQILAGSENGVVDTPVDINGGYPGQ